MEEKRRDAAGTQPASNADSPAAEPSSTRRRGGAQKRKASSLGGSTSSSTPSKRFAREKPLLSHTPIHNGPLTRARQGPSSLASASAAVKPAAQAKRPDPVGEAVAELVKRESELEAQEASMEAEFEAIRSRGANAHVVPSHCGWFSWTKVHSIEEQMLASFFNGKSETRTPDVYLEIRNCIMKKFHANPGTFIELKDLLELEVGEFDARQEVLEFLDHWGLINFHPFPPTCSAVASARSDGVAEKDSLVDKLYHFEELQSRSSVVPKTNITTPTLPSGLFPESAIAEELVWPEGPSVEYHCNSCSADCSRKRYHCQKQADFDLCTDCFNNGKFDSGMSSSDFILMEPAEAPGVSGGNWTDQETLLLLEALELYKENWNEIAEHVATKTKAQCILHFVQMPIEDTFLDYEDGLEGSAKETADPTSTGNDLSAPKDAPETTENKTAVNESDPQTSPMETSKQGTEVNVGEDTSKPEDLNEVKDGEETSKLEDTCELKVDQETDENFALKALKEAFEVVGYPPMSEGHLSFTEVGNPAMALAAFLARLVGPDAAIASAHNSLKSISASSPGTELAARHCFILEDPPNDSKEQAGPDSVSAEGDTQKDKVHEDKSQKADNSTSGLDDKDLSNDNSDKKLEKPSTEEKSQSAKEQDDIVSHEEVGNDNLKKSDNLELPKDESPTTVGESTDSKVETGHQTSSEKESGEGAGKPSEPTEAVRDVDMSDSVPSTKNETQQPVTSNSVEEPLQSEEASKDVDVSNSLATEINEPQPLVTAKSQEPPERTVVPKDVDMVCDSQTPQKDEPQQPVASNSVVEKGAICLYFPGEDQTKDGKIEKHDSTETKVGQKIDKLKLAAVSAVSAAAVKAKLLAEQEEDQIRQLAAMLVEKQVHKLEAKLGFFNEMEHVVMRVREQLDRSRQKLYHERAQIIASRLGLPGSSRGMPSSMPANRMAMNMANSSPRPPLGITSHRPPMSRPTGAVALTSNQFSATTLAGSSLRPPSQDKL
ncbi:SWI/SNF complex subunit SWI3D-like isoform X1 [Pyrus communis]|uniref:SWI/SNF complex subunit SWI3D-like isoform X1 n=1 Tax=Pyrus communis TaxID=23211 RepID=UPI0035C256C7